MLNADKILADLDKRLVEIKSGDVGSLASEIERLSRACAVYEIARVIRMAVSEGHNEDDSESV